MADSKTQGTILVVDDDVRHAESTSDSLEVVGYRTDRVNSGRDALEAIRKKEYELVLADLILGDMDGIELLRQARKVRPNLPLIVFTGHGSVETAVEAMLEGAVDYIQKPLNVEGLRIKVQKALEAQDLRRQNLDLQRRLDKKFGFQGIVGNSQQMHRIVEKLTQVSDTDASVLILGESGTGKELIARSIHENSRRRKRNFVPINCGALSPQLVESELFGHEKGAFTGATSQRKGRFEFANGGTLFLDEIGDMPLDTQVKLLRVLEDGQVYRVGSNEPVQVSVRVISATNQNPEEQIEKGAFREDLYYRLKVVTVEMPPLRERPEDIPLLVEEFMRDYARIYQKPVQSVDQETLGVLSRYSWPGNVRELKNCIEEMVVVSQGLTLTLDAVPERIYRSEAKGVNRDFLVGVTLRDMERELIRNTLKSVKGNRREAARILGIGERTLYRKLKQYDLG